MKKTCSPPSRRHFLKKMGGGVLAASLLGTNSATAIPLPLPQERGTPPDGEIRLACIGMGIQGFSDVKAALETPGVRLVAAADLYTGRLARTREVYGPDVFTTRDYREILDRSDVDAVIVATPDHWHDHITIAALDAGKHVYCEKPMVQHLDEGHAVLAAEQRNPGVLMVGSQRVSSILLAKAKELYQRGDIGRLVLVETFNDRFSAMGAWQYSIPRDASPQTIDWDAFLGDAPKVPFDPTRFFRWRNYRDYGTGVAGDLFVHLFSGAHFILDSLGPSRVYATGGLRYWNDGRDVPDVFIASCDYDEQPGHPAFNMQLRVNFVDSGGSGSRTRLVGTEGTLDLSGSQLTLRRNTVPAKPGYGGWDSYNTFPEAGQEEFRAWYEREYAGVVPAVQEPGEAVYRRPDGYSDHVHHFRNWFDAIRSGGTVVEDGAFGFRAAAPSLAANLSYYEQRVVNWDAVGMRVSG